MESEEKKKEEKKGASRFLKLETGSRMDYQAEAGWLTLYSEEKPRAEMFFIRYSAVDEQTADRPVTFVFNGGPGASSVYLHLGAMGPKRAVLTESGQAPSSPYRLTDNEETWLEFTDLVFIDPIGTGFSRTIEGSEQSDKDKTAGGTDEKKSDDEYWKLKRDLESLSEFIRKFLSKYNRWESPVYIAGESYGGFRVGKLVRMLQQDYGVGLKGAVLISPALEFSLLEGSDYDALSWIDVFPSFADAAAVHGKSRKIKEEESSEDYRKRAADFALNELLPVLAGGELVPESKRLRILSAAADFIGLSRETIITAGGRIGIEFFVKNLLRNEKLVLGLYDSSVTVNDPFPDRDKLESPDPTLHQLERVFAAGINTQLRAGIGLNTEKDYNLLSMKVNESWKVDTREHDFETHVGAVDDLRYGMSLNPDMKVYISNGIYDLVTPAFASDRLAALMKLKPEQKRMLTVKHYNGGHMYYTWQQSRIEFFNDMKKFYSVG